MQQGQELHISVSELKKVSQYHRLSCSFMWQEWLLKDTNCSFLMTILILPLVNVVRLSNVFVIISTTNGNFSEKKVKLDKGI